MATLELIADAQAELINGGYKDFNLALIKATSFQKNTSVIKGFVVGGNTVEQSNVVAIKVG